MFPAHAPSGRPDSDLVDRALELRCVGAVNITWPEGDQHARSRVAIVTGHIDWNAQQVVVAAILSPNAAFAADGVERDNDAL